MWQCTSELVCLCDSVLVNSFVCVAVYWCTSELVCLCVQAKAKPEEEVKPMKEPDLKPQKDTGCVVS